jgi:GTP-binding protein HflX
VFDRPEGGSRALLVELDLGEGRVDERLNELAALAASAGAEVVGRITGRRQRPDPATFAGKGKVEEIGTRKADASAELVIFDHPLSGVQQRNLEQALGCRVVDRTSLILDIFAQRARSSEGKLQVELAQLKHMATRLVGVARSRATQGRTRRRAAVRTVALVGYTNAGKSTLFNRLTGARVEAVDQLFATLDTTLRRIYLPGAGAVVLSDTVGFIRDLPHDLVAAFRATLAEATEADLLLHVIDASAPDRDDQVAAVEAVLAEIGADAIPQIRVLNKCDRTSLAPGLTRDPCGKISAVCVSATTGAGCDELREALAERLSAEAGASPTIPLPA